MFGLTDEEIIRNQREMFYDRKFEAVLEAAAESEQASATGDSSLGGGGDLGGGGGGAGLILVAAKQALPEPAQQKFLVPMRLEP